MGCSLSTSPNNYETTFIENLIMDDSEVPRENQMHFSSFTIFRNIGKGGFGKVCIVSPKSNNHQLYALKYVSKEKLVSSNSFRLAAREQHILKCLNCPFVVNLWYAFQDIEDVVIVCDLMLGGDLQYHLDHTKHRFSEECCIFYLSQIALALDYLRCSLIIHRDVKPSNILLDEIGNAHLSDFGTSCICTENELKTRQIGTLGFMAPEVIFVKEHNGYNYAADWWSLGITIYYLFHGKKPFDISNGDKLHEIVYKLKDASILRLSTNLTPAFIQTLGKLLAKDPAVRIQTLDDVQRQEIFANFNWVEQNQKSMIPPFKPSNKMNVDPAYELNELLVEDRPLRKKSVRIRKTVKQLQKKSPCDLTEAEGKIKKCSALYKYYDRNLMGKLDITEVIQNTNPQNDLFKIFNSHESLNDVS